MYITEAIQQSKSLHPAEYTTEEYIRWCDELSGDIRRSYDISYGVISQSSSEVLLPENVSVNDVSKIIMDGKELSKTDLRDFGIEYEYTDRGKVLKKRDGRISDFTIIYAVPYTPIRWIDKDAEAEFSDGCFFCNTLPLLPGDVLKITSDGQEYTVSITDITDEGYTYFGDALPEGKYTARFYHEITDKTLLPAPYDTAYIDFLNAKVSLYQGDRDGYKTFMGQFNEKIEDYRRYLTRSMPRKKAKFINWI